MAGQEEGGLPRVARPAYGENCHQVELGWSQLFPVQEADAASFKAAGEMVANSRGDRGSVVSLDGCLPSYELIVLSDKNLNNCFSIFRTSSEAEADARYEHSLI